MWEILAFIVSLAFKWVRRGRQADARPSFPVPFEGYQPRWPGNSCLLARHGHRGGNWAHPKELRLAHPEKETIAAEETDVLVAPGSSYWGSLLVTDRLRPSAAPAVETMREMNIKVVLLRGIQGQPPKGGSGPTRHH
jgi:hypothetical protein